MSYPGPGLLGNNEYNASEPYVLHGREAGEDIGILTDAASGVQHPVNPFRAFGIPLYLENLSGTTLRNQDLIVKIVSTALATVTRYEGISTVAARKDATITVRNRGDAWFIAGKSAAAIAAGALVCLDINSTENSNGASAGDVIPLREANDAYGTNTLTNIVARLEALVGRTMTPAPARTSSTVYDVTRVRMRGY